MIGSSNLPVPRSMAGSEEAEIPDIPEFGSSWDAEAILQTLAESPGSSPAGMAAVLGGAPGWRLGNGRPRQVHTAQAVLVFVTHGFICFFFAHLRADPQ